MARPKRRLVGLGLAVISWVVIGVAAKAGLNAAWRGAAREAVAAKGFKIVSLDLETDLRCGLPAVGYIFHATRDGHLYAGGVCAGPLTREPIVVHLPALR